MYFHSSFRSVLPVMCGMMLVLLGEFAATAQDRSKAASNGAADALAKPMSVLMNAKVFRLDKPDEEFLAGSGWEAWVEILEHQGGAGAFEQIYDHAESTTAGKIYALCGLYFCDYERFEKKIETHRKDPLLDRVTIQLGDVFSHSSAGEVIENNRADTPHARLCYGESLFDYAYRTGKALPLDVAGGGIPAQLLDEGWMFRASMVDFAEHGAPSVEDGKQLIKLRELFYKRWRRALELNQKADAPKAE